MKQKIVRMFETVNEAVKYAEKIPHEEMHIRKIGVVGFSLELIIGGDGTETAVREPRAEVRG